MSTVDTRATLALGQIARNAMIVLLETLNTELAYQDEHWAPLDQELAELRLGEAFDPETFEPTTLEKVATENFYLGHVPSLIEAPVEKYPNVAVDADRAGSSGSDQLDQAQMLSDSLYIEFMVKSLASEEEVSARAARMVDALHNCIQSNPTLRGVVNEIGETPTAQLSDVFVRNSDVSYGDTWFWRGGRLEYSVNVTAQRPAGSFLRSASYPDIDQS